MNLDSDVLLALHDRIRHGCVRCQLHKRVLQVSVDRQSDPCVSCPGIDFPPWGSEFVDAALYPLAAGRDVPEGLLCFSCRNPQTFCRSHHRTNPYFSQPCLHTLDISSLPPDLYPGSPSLWADLVVFLLASHPEPASSFVLMHGTASGHSPPSAWSVKPPPVLTPLDYLDWFNHTGPGMSPPPSNLIALHNGACLIVHLFHLHFAIDLL